ncbi:MAG: methyltransferase domain-containing protein [Burkholderiaceae bacterium]
MNLNASKRTEMVKHRPVKTTGTGAARRSALQQYRMRAHQYDLELQPFEPLRQEAIARLRLQPGEVVVDVGCGTGLSFAPLMEKLGPTGRVVGIEQCPEMMTRASERIDRSDWKTQVSLIQASAQEAQWRGRADAAIFHFTHDVLRSPAAIGNVLAHLRPGARVVATGLQWAAPWAGPVNLFVMGAALYSVTSLDGLAQPWSELAKRLQDFEHQPTWMGCVYIATGTWPGPAST